MEISVIIPTYQGESNVLRLLEALEHQSFSPSEVIVVIDGSTDNTKSTLAARKFEIRDLIIIDQPNAGRAGARNAGAEKATGDLLLFFDDDIIPFVDCIDKHRNFHINNLRSLLVGNASQYLSESSNDFEKYRAYLSEIWVSEFPSHEVKLTSDNLFLMAANFSINKKDFFLLGGFDAKLTDAEDLDLGVRAFNSDFSVFFDKSIEAFHYERLTSRIYIRRLRQYAKANAIVKEKHVGFFKGKKLSLNKMKKAIYYLCSFSVFVFCIDKGLFKLLFPRALRYKLYSSITFSLSQIYSDQKI